MKNLLRTLLPLIFVSLAGFALAQTAPEGIRNADTRLASWEAEAERVDAALADESIDTQEAADLRALIEPHRTQARALADAAKRELAPIQEQINALGPAPAEGESEDAGVASQRAQFQKRIDELKGIVAKADLAFTRADSLLADIAEAQRRRFTERLLTRGPSPLVPANWIAAGESLINTGSSTASETLGAATDGKRMQVWRESGPLALAGLLLAIVMMFVARRAALRWLYGVLRSREQVDADTEAAAFGGTENSRESAPAVGSSTLPEPQIGAGPSRARRLLVGIGVTLTRLAMPLVAIFAARQALLALQVFGPTGEAILDGLTRAAIILAAAYTLIYAFFAPHEPRLRLSILKDRQAAIASWVSMLIAFAIALDYAVVQVGQRLGWPIEALSVLNAAILVLGAIPLWRLARIGLQTDEAEATTEEQPAEEAELWLSERASTLASRLAYVVAIVSPLLALAGYFALSRFVFYNALQSAAVIAVLVLIYSAAREACSALSEATRDRRRGRKGEAGDSEEHLSLLPVFIAFVLILIAIPILALIWGATTDDLGEAYFALTNGFTVGESTFRPGDIVIAALVFGMGLFLTRTIQAVMRRTVMPRTRLDTGARSSIVAGLGYLGFFVSALVAIGAAGLDLSSLAFLGAALGVGIGFGLTNIINNFVSGVILLIERPIKVGDWIEVGGVHGTVDKVNVRSTEIRTFDKASYIVPNSDLISSPVTNMTHGDLLGRVIAPVGVAYGTDVRKVEKILLEIARAHPMTLRQPPPSVIFKAFGADSLDFELRAFLRDVNWVMFTLSDINFEIDRRFREEGIEIPFAQRDLHIKDAEPLVKAMSTYERAPRGQNRRPERGDTGEADADGDS